MTSSHTLSPANSDPSQTQGDDCHGDCHGDCSVPRHDDESFTLNRLASELEESPPQTPPSDSNVFDSDNDGMDEEFTRVLFGGEVGDGTPEGVQR